MILHICSHEACSFARLTTASHALTVVQSPLSGTEMAMKEAEDPYFRRKEAHEAQRLLPYRSLQDKITVLH